VDGLPRLQAFPDRDTPDSSAAAAGVLEFLEPIDP
jgi:hypothetical protein